MSIPLWVSQLFQSIDDKDTDRFTAHLSPNVSFRFGNAETVQGREAVAAMIDPFFQAIAGLRHDLIEVWEVDKSAICRGEVCYTRHDGTTLQVPFVNVLKRADGTIDEYQIYVDSSRLFAG